MNKKTGSRNHRIKTTVPKTFKEKNRHLSGKPTFGETKKKDEKPPEVTTKSEQKLTWNINF